MLLSGGDPFILPLGVLQLSAALEHGYWYARSAEFMDQAIVHLLVWMRMPDELGHVNDATQHITQPIQVLDHERRLSRRVRTGYPVHEQLAPHQRPLR